MKSLKKKQAKDIARLIKRSFNEFVASSFSSKATKKWLMEVATPRKIIDRSKERNIYVAVKNGKVMGVIEGTAKNRNYRVSLLFIDKKYHRKGAARRLVNKIESVFRKKGVKIMKAHSSLYATEFYEKMGYKKSRGISKKKGMMYQPMKKNLK